MKRAVLTAMFFCGVAALSGCPIYNHNDEGCYRDGDCANGYACDRNSGECYQPGTSTGSSCTRPEQCDFGRTCGRNGQCASGDCSFNGCVRGYVCDSSSGIWACVSGSSGSGGGGVAGEDEQTSAGAAGSSALSAGSGGDSAGQAGAP